MQLSELFFVSHHIDQLDDKNPKDIEGWTPLHEAAQEGHRKIYDLIRENVEDKDPADENGETPSKLMKNKVQRTA